MRRSLTGLAAAAVLVAPLMLMPTTGSGSPAAAAAAPGEEPRIAFTADQDSLHEVDVAREVSETGFQSFEASNRRRRETGAISDPAAKHEGEASVGAGLPVFVSTADEEHGEIYQEGDATATRLTCNDVVETHPVEQSSSFFSSGAVAFASNADGDWDIYVATPPVIVPGRAPAAQPEGAVVPAAAPAAAPPTLCDPTWTLEKITNNTADDTWPTWTSDGSLVFSSTIDDPLGDVHRAVHNDGPGWFITNLTSTPGVADTQPAATEISTGVPSGCEGIGCPTDSCNDDDLTNTWVAFTTTRYRPDGSIGLLNIDRPALGVLDAWDGDPNQSSEPSWSPCPEDQHLAFTSTQRDPYGDVVVGAILQPQPGDGPEVPEVLPRLTNTARVADAPGVAESHPTWTNRFGPGTDGRDDNADVLFTSRTADSSAFDEPIEPPFEFEDGVHPDQYDDVMAPGEAVTIDKMVNTPQVAPNPDIVFMADTTGSMSGEIANVQSNAQAILNNITASQPTAQYAVAGYKDGQDGAEGEEAFTVYQPLTATQSEVVAGINQWDASGGGDSEAESWIGALGLTPGSIGFRPDSTRIVVMFGDAPSHDPSEGFTLSTAISSLQGAQVRVIAIGLPGPLGPDRFDSLGQATAVTNQTGGSLSEANAQSISQRIIDELNDVLTDVTHSTSCDDGLTSEVTPASQTVQAGNIADFQETITVSPDANLGETLTCEVSFLINGQALGPEFVQTINIEVEDLRSPTNADIDDAYADQGAELGTDRRTIIAESGEAEPDEMPYDEAGPAYSPDGTKIAYSRDILLTEDSEPRARELWVANADGTEPKLLLPAGLRPQGAVDVDPVWSPDGTRVAFTRYELSEFGGHLDPRVMVANLAAGTVHTVTVPPEPSVSYADQDPSWSPDGRFIVLARHREFPEAVARAGRRGTPNVTPTANLQLWVVDTSGNGQEARLRHVFNCGGDGCFRNVRGRSPAWSPDGTTIAYDDHGALRIVQVAPAELTPDELADGEWFIDGFAAVTGFTDAADNPLGQGGPPTASRGTISVAEDPAWSPDGTTLAFAGQPAGQPDQRGIWTIKPDGTGLRPVTDLHPPGSAEEERYDDTRGPETEPAWQPDFRADVAVTVAISGSPAAIGAPITVTWKVTNNGPTTAQNVVLATSYTADGTAAAAAPPAGCLAGGSGCTLPTLAMGATVTYEVTLTYAAAVNGTATGTVSTTSPDPDLTNNEATAKYRVDPDAPPPPDDRADIAVSVALDEPIGYVGGRRTATFTVTNRGPDTAADVQLTAAYAEVFNEIGPTCFADDAACSLGDFPAGTTKRFTVGVRTPTAGSGLISARVKTTTVDPRLANNHDQVRLPVRQPTIRVLPSVARPGMVVLAYGENMPPGSRVRLVWDRGITVDRRPVRVGPDGKIRASLLVVRRDLLGARLLQARSVSKEFSMVEGALLVVLRLQSGTDLIGRG